METTQDFLDKLDKLTYINCEGKTLHTAEGFDVSYEIELMGGKLSKYPLQFIFRVRKNNTHVLSWGCSSNDDNILANCWWQSKVSKVHDLLYDKESKNKSELLNEFKQLIIN